MLLANFNGKEHLRHRAVSLRQHGFLVEDGVNTELRTDSTVKTLAIGHCTVAVAPSGSYTRRERTNERTIKRRQSINHEALSI